MFPASGLFTILAVCLLRLSKPGQDDPNLAPRLIVEELRHAVAIVILTQAINYSCAVRVGGDCARERDRAVAYGNPRVAKKTKWRIYVIPGLAAGDRLKALSYNRHSIWQGVRDCRALLIHGRG